MKRFQPTQSLRRRGVRGQRGFTLVEMMVAVTIGLIVILGVTVTFVNLKGAWGTQDKLAQLQDNERLAMAFLTSAVQEAGYYPDPLNTNPISGFTDATYGSTAAGQIMVGTTDTTTSSDSLSTVFATAGGDGLLNCQGATYSGSGTISVRNTFYVDTTNKTLNCKVDGPSPSVMTATTAPLVSGVASMTVLYNVNTTNSPNPVYQYYPASSMTAATWPLVKSVRITLNFVNPNASLGGTATIPWVQTVNLMNNQ